LAASGPRQGWAAFTRPEEVRQGAEDDLCTLRLERLDVVHLRYIPTVGVVVRKIHDVMFYGGFRDLMSRARNLEASARGRSRRTSLRRLLSVGCTSNESEESSFW
jgi:hypothetical protein